MCIPPSSTLLKDSALLSTSLTWSLTHPEAKLVSLLSALVHLFKLASYYLSECTMNISLWVKFHWHCIIYPSLLSAQHIVAFQIHVELHWASESKSEGLIRFLFRLRNQKARLTEKCLKAKQVELLIQGPIGHGEASLEMELGKKQKATNRPQNPILLGEKSFITKPNCTWKHIRMKSPFCIKLNSSLSTVNYIWECGSLPIVWRNFKVSRIVRQNGWLSTNDIC